MRSLLRMSEVSITLNFPLDHIPARKDTRGHYVKQLMCYCFKIMQNHLKKNEAHAARSLDEEVMLTVVGPQPFVERGERCFADF